MLENGHQLEQLRSASNDVVFRLNGKMLSSKIDPRKEADQWVLQTQLLARLSKTIVLIGVGSGYHLIALKSKYPAANIIAISSSQELLSGIQAIHKEAVAGIAFYCATSLEEFYEAEVTQAAFSTTTVVLKHPTYKFEESPVLESIEEAVVARTYPALKKYISKNEPLTISLPAIPVMIGLASIKTINDASTAGTANNIASPWLAIRTLNELVK